MLRNNLRRLINVFEYPELLPLAIQGVNRSFAKDLLFIKNKLGITPRTILDVGAAVGEYSKAARLVFPEAHVYLFEPIPQSCEELRRISLNDNHLTVFEMALSTRNEKSCFHHNKFSFSSSLLPMTERHTIEFPFTRNEKFIHVECRRLDSLSEIRLTRPALMKIDVQGAELQVLIGAESLLPEFAAVTLEVNFEKFYENQADISDIFTLMKRNGLRYFLQQDVVFSLLTGKPLSCDILFFR